MTVKFEFGDDDVRIALRLYAARCSVVAVHRLECELLMALPKRHALADAELSQVCSLG